MRRFRRHFDLVWWVLLLLTQPVAAHDGSHHSVHDTVAGIIVRMRHDLSPDELVALTVPKVEAFLTAEEREVLGSAHVRFRVDVPVMVTIVRDTSLGEEPFWLRERGFQATGMKVKLGNREFDTWEKAFAAGEVGLGVHS